MGLDVSLVVNEPVLKRGTGIYVRENGQNKELSYEEAVERYGVDNVEIQEFETNEVYSDSITHNMVRMAKVAGLYDVLWRPFLVVSVELTPEGAKVMSQTDLDIFEEETEVYARDLIPHLEKGLAWLVVHELDVEHLNPENGWGDFDTLLNFTRNYLKACIMNPLAQVEVWR